MERVIGEGEIAMVHRAVDLHLERPVAIKLLRERYAQQPRFVESFLQEARTAARISHPNIVSIYDVGTDEGIPFIVMEYVDGPTLKQILLRDGPQETDRVLRVGIQLAEALHWAHSRGMVHRDVKPQNLLLDRGDRVRIVDFGIALAYGAATGTSEKTIIGTPEYLSPEQAEGKTPGPESDVYSAGAVLYEMIAGHPPFTAEDRSLIPRKQIEDDPPPLHALNPSVPESLEKVIFKALVKDPKSRYRSAADLAAELRRLRSATQQPTVMDSSTIQIPVAWRATRLHRALAAVVGPVAAPLLIAGAALLLFFLALAGLFQSSRTLQSAEATATTIAAGADATAVAVRATAGAVQVLLTRSALESSVAATAQAQAAATAVPLQGTATAIAATSTALALQSATNLSIQPVHATSVALLTSVREVYEYGDGRLEHQRTGVARAVITTTELFRPAVSLRNFVATVRFSNPYGPSEGTWDYGLGFRSRTANDGYRLYIDSAGRWNLLLASSSGGRLSHDEVERGQAGAARLDRAGSNELTLLAKEKIALFYVNGQYVATLDVSNLDMAGDIWAGTGFVQGNTLSGRATEFRDFKAWALPG